MWAAIVNWFRVFIWSLAFSGMISAVALAEPTWLDFQQQAEKLYQQVDAMTSAAAQPKKEDFLIASQYALEAAVAYDQAIMTLARTQPLPDNAPLKRQELLEKRQEMRDTFAAGRAVFEYRLRRGLI